LDYTQSVSEFGSKSLGEVLLEPTMLYSGVLNQILASELGDSVHALSHVTGGGIAANLSRVLPVGVSLEISRASWSPNEVFRVLAEWGAYQLEALEGTWNLGLGFAAVVDSSSANAISAKLNQLGVKTWQLGVLEHSTDISGFVTSAKGVEGGAVRLSGSYA
jgi:phosphoribosylformylglycinamidine cyclo-ligase